MKLYFLVVLAICQLDFSLSSDEDSLKSPTLWSQWKGKYNKKYKSSEEESLRREIFKQRVDYVNQHNERYENGDESFELGIYGYADRTREEFNNLRTGLSMPR
jgi:hypothetical protein